MALDPAKVPASCVPLLPLAERWGLGDDFDRSALVDQASLDELTVLVGLVDAVPDSDLYGWLAGPDSHSERPTEEYLAVTNLTMAVDQARLRLRRS